MSPLAETLLLSLSIVAVAMLILWTLSLKLKDASIADPFWGTGFVLITWFAVLWNMPVQGRQVLLLVLVTLWGLRLSSFLLRRNLGHGEDQRYKDMREHHGHRFWWVSLFTVFLLQGLLMWFVSFPIQAVASQSGPATLGWLDILGTVIWLVGFVFEAGGDWQLARFKSNPDNAGKVLDRGFWRFTRHPNYFGDFCVWWGIYLISVNAGGAWTITSPLLMSVLLLKVSGVALLEKTITQRRPEYADYIRRTNAFFPGPPRRSESS